MANTHSKTYAVLVLGLLLLSGCDEPVPRDTSSLLLPRFQRSEVVGFVAGLGTTFAALPDLVKMIKARSSKGINPTPPSPLSRREREMNE